MLNNNNGARFKTDRQGQNLHALLWTANSFRDEMLKSQYSPVTGFPDGDSMSRSQPSSSPSRARAKEPRVLPTSLSISAPIAFASPNQTTPSNIILVIKHDFIAENERELSVVKGDLVKLLDTPGNAWLLVKYIDRVAEPGLVPAFYVDIAINDTRNPVTLTWLRGCSTPSEQVSSDLWDDSLLLKLHLKDSSLLPLTINGKSYPISVSISSFFLYNQRYWYRLDVAFSNKSYAHLCRYYEDFYSMHAELLSLVTESPTANAPRLPKLPEPSSSVGTAMGEEAIAEASVKVLLRRCNDLNTYLNSLILIPYFRLSQPLLDWFDVKYKQLPAMIFMDGEERFDVLTVNKNLLPGSTDILNNFYTAQKGALLKTGSAPSQESGVQRTRSKNIYNHYHQAAVERVGLVLRSQSQRAKSAPSPKSANSSNMRIPTVGEYSPPGKTSPSSHNALPHEKEFKPTSGSDSLSHLNLIEYPPPRSQPALSRPHEKNAQESTPTKPSNSQWSPQIPSAPLQTLLDLKKMSISPAKSSVKRPIQQQHTYLHTDPPRSGNPRIRARSDGAPVPVIYQPIDIPRFHSTNSRRARSMNLKSNSPTPAASPGPYIKLKVIVSDVEIVALKASKTSIKNLSDLKSIIRQRIPFGHLHIKLPGTNSFHDVDVISFDVVECMQTNDKLLFETH